MVINTMLIDDEQHALDTLTILLNEHDQINIVGASSDPLEAIRIICDRQVDLLFVDIEMKDINGISLVSKIREFNSTIIVVFVTAYKNYTEQAIKLNVFNYLLKPIERIELSEVVKKISKLILPEDEDKDTFLLSQKGETIVIRKEDVACLMAEGSYTHIHMLEGEHYVYPQNLGKMISLIHLNKLIKVNRSSYIRKDLIVSFNKKEKKCSYHYNNSLQTIDASPVFFKQLNGVF